MCLLWHKLVYKYIMTQTCMYWFHKSSQMGMYWRISPVQPRSLAKELHFYVYNVKKRQYYYYTRKLRTSLYWQTDTCGRRSSTIIMSTFLAPEGAGGGGGGMCDGTWPQENRKMHVMRVCVCVFYGCVLWVWWDVVSCVNITECSGLQFRSYMFCRQRHEISVIAISKWSGWVHLRGRWCTLDRQTWFWKWPEGGTYLAAHCVSRTDRIA